MSDYTFTITPHVRTDESRNAEFRPPSDFRSTKGVRYLKDKFTKNWEISYDLHRNNSKRQQIFVSKEPS